MRLLIDIGNTRLKWAVLKEGMLGKQHSFRYQQEYLPDQLFSHWSTLISPAGVHVASVAGEQITNGLRQWVAIHWGCPVEILHSEKQCCGVINGYTKPESLGVDRWAAMVAAFGIIGSSVCVIDSGTAVTFDVINSKGRHLGGVIAPGQDMMRHALLDSTARVFIDEPSRAVELLGTDTTSCVLSGGLQATIGLIERMAQQVQHQLDEAAVLVLTGGGADHLIPLLSIPYQHVENLVLQGVARIVEDRRG